MKNYIYTGCLWALFSYLFIACSPQEFDKYSVGSVPSEADVSFVFKPKADDPNIIEFENTSPRAGVANWKFGNGSSGKGDFVTAEYPFGGEFEVELTLITSGGVVSKTETISIQEDNLSLLDHPLYTALTGGPDVAEGKTWVFAQYEGDHVGVGPSDATTPEWWAAQSNEKEECSLYENSYTFKQVGVEMIWENQGKIYTNEPGKDDLLAKGFGPASVPPAGDFDVDYQPQDKYTFSLNTSDSTLTISDGGFLGFYAGSSEFKILDIDDTHMSLRVKSTVEDGNAWFFKFVVEELNVEPEKEPIPVKAVPLSEDFESKDPTVVFDLEDMGSLTNASYSNPAPVGINTSSKAYLYQKKAGEPFSNVSFVAEDYKFDLKTQATIKMKVYIPSYNDYKTENEVAGDWITNKVLQPSLAVRLQNNELGENAWESQTEILVEDLEMDTWLELTFDFSHVSDRIDYDKIVLLFGTEGHHGEGIFFFDDFSFE